MKRSFRYLLTVFALVAVAVFAYLAYRAYLYKAHPIEYEDYVLKYSDEYRVSTSTIFAVIKAESSFRSDAVSPSGAIGLMQIMPETLEWLCKKKGEAYLPEMIYDPETNIRYGTFYLSWLYESFSDWNLVYAAYNAGHNKVRSWLEDGEISENGELLHIPYTETQNYVRRVCRNRETYQKLYTERGWKNYE